MTGDCSELTSVKTQILHNTESGLIEDDKEVDSKPYCRTL